MSSAQKIIQAAAGNAAGEATYVEDVFSTYLYDGNGSTQTITNGIDLDGEGGLVWIKNRYATDAHILCDTERGVLQKLSTNLNSAEATDSNTITAFNSNGFSIGLDVKVNTSTEPYSSWTFAKQEKFFDVVTYTGDGNTGRTVAHNLGSVPGMIITKRTDSTSNWFVWHRSFSSNDNYLMLNNTQAETTNATFFGGAPTDTTFTVGSNANINGSGGEYVAYLFAHNDGDGEFGESADQDIIKCGSYTGNGTTPGPFQDLGFEPQWLLIKNASATSDWLLIDSARGIALNRADRTLYANGTNAEQNVSITYVQALPNGFNAVGSHNSVNTSGATYIYVAIARGGTKTPTSAEDVFAVTKYTSDNSDNRLIDTGIFTDMVISHNITNDTVENPAWGARLLGQDFLESNSSDARIYDADGFMSPSSLVGDAFSTMAGYGVGNDANAGLNASSAQVVSYAFQRARKFFDVITYTGNGTAGNTVPHNLGVAPDLIIIKKFLGVERWTVYHSGLSDPETKAIFLNTTDVPLTSTSYWNDTSPTDSIITLGTNGRVNDSASYYVGFLWANLPGICKIGSYTGDGTTDGSNVIDCGFSSGARFVMIKETSGTGNWFVFDSERGITSGSNDPFFHMNSIANDDTNANSDLYPDSTGFGVIGDQVNEDTTEYIFLAIA